MIRLRFVRAALAASLFVGLCGFAAGPDDVLVENSLAKLTRGDYEADLERVPPEMREEFATSPKRLTALLNNLLVTKTLAIEARNSGVDRDPRVARLLALETDRILAQEQVKRIEDAAGARFDARQQDFLLKARETYEVFKSKYRMPEQVKASHILFDTRKGAPEAALARANEARAKLLAGADFATLAKEISDDPSVKSNGGELGWFARGKMDPQFTRAAFALAKEGELSEPVLSSFGYHLIRFEGRRAERQQSFDEVKDSIMAGLRTGYINEERDAKLDGIRNDPTMKIDQAAVDGLVVRLDPDAFQRALDQAQRARRPN
jgi:peptidyl-prolyl cis-trans isomerase C